MDWSTSDYTRTYADTFFLPYQDHDTGVHLFDEGGAGPKNSWLGPDLDDEATDSRIRVPIRPYAGGSCGGLSQWDGPRGYPVGRHGRAALDTHHATPYNKYRTQLGARTPTGQKKASMATLSATAGTTRPYSTPPGTRRAAPPLQPERRVGLGAPRSAPEPPALRRGPGAEPRLPDDHPIRGAGRPQGFIYRVAGRSSSAWTAEIIIQVIKVILLVIIVVLLAMTLAAPAGRGFRLHFIGKVSSVGRPRRIQFRNLTRLRQVHDLASLR